VAGFSTAPGTNCAIGLRFGRPVVVVSFTGTALAAAEAARQPSSAAVCQPFVCG